MINVELDTVVMQTFICTYGGMVCEVIDQWIQCIEWV